MAGLPGAFDRYDIPALRLMLDRYGTFPSTGCAQNLARFLREVIPTAEEVGIRMAIHPDDPPRPMMGLPRIVSCADDLAFITDAVDIAGERHHPLHRLARRRGAERRPGDRQPVRRRIHFVASAQRRQGAGWLLHGGGPSGRRHRHGGVVETMLGRAGAPARRSATPTGACRSVPDHGHELLDDVGKDSFPGYSAIGRLKGLAESARRHGGGGFTTRSLPV